MNFGNIHFSINSLRLLAVASLIAEAVAHFARLQPATRDFLTGLGIGMMLVLTAGLFYAPRATVERMPHEDLPAKLPRDTDELL